MAEATAGAGEQKASPYAWYVLGILFVVYVLNFIDRQVIAILAEEIKRDLHLKDEDLGFLYGTAFGVFYALFGIPLGLALGGAVALLLDRTVGRRTRDVRVDVEHVTTPEG